MNEISSMHEIWLAFGFTEKEQYGAFTLTISYKSTGTQRTKHEKIRTFEVNSRIWYYIEGMKDKTILFALKETEDFLDKWDTNITNKISDNFNEEYKTIDIQIPESMLLSPRKIGITDITGQLEKLGKTLMIEDYEVEFTIFDGKGYERQFGTNQYKIGVLS